MGRGVQLEFWRHGDMVFMARLPVGECWVVYQAWTLIVHYILFFFLRKLSQTYSINSGHCFACCVGWRLEGFWDQLERKRGNSWGGSRWSEGMGSRTCRYVDLAACPFNSLLFSGSQVPNSVNIFNLVKLFLLVQGKIKLVVERQNIACRGGGLSILNFQKQAKGPFRWRCCSWKGMGYVPVSGITHEQI